MDEKKFKDGGKGSGIGNFLRKIGKSGLIKKAVGIVGAVGSGNYLGALKVLISKDPDITPEQVSEANKLIDLEFKDRADARDLQKVALQQDDLFSKRFIYYLTTGVFAFSVTIVLLLFFIEIPDKNRDVINFILGVVIGTGLTGIFQYFFGSSSGSSDKSKQLNLILNNRNKEY